MMRTFLEGIKNVFVTGLAGLRAYVRGRYVLRRQARKPCQDRAQTTETLAAGASFGTFKLILRMHLIDCVSSTRTMAHRATLTQYVAIGERV